MQNLVGLLMRTQIAIWILNFEERAGDGMGAQLTTEFELNLFHLYLYIFPFKLMIDGMLRRYRVM